MISALKSITACPRVFIRPTKRRSKQQMEELKGVIYGVVSQNNPMTVRQVFYQLVSLGAIDKTENEYKSTVVRLLGIMRLEAELPFGWLVDYTRWMRKPRSYTGMEAALEE